MEQRKFIEDAYSAKTHMVKKNSSTSILSGQT